MKVGFLHEKTSKSGEFTKKEILKKLSFTLFRSSDLE